MGRKKMVFLGILLLLIPLPSFSADNIKIGLLLTSSGPQGYLGEAAIKGAEAVASAVNKEGGIQGRSIELISYNEEGKEEKAVLGFQKFVKQDQVQGIVGPSLTGPSAAVEKVNKAGPPVVSTSGGYVAPGDSYMFASGAVQSGEILKLLFSKWFKEKGYTRIGLLAGVYASGQEWVKYAEQYVKEYPGLTLAVEHFKLTDVDVVSQFMRLKQQDPQILVVSAVGKASIMVAKNFNQLGFDIPIMFSHSNSSTSFLELLGSDRPKTKVLFPVFAINIWKDLPESHPQKAACVKLNELYKTLHKHEIQDHLFVGMGADATTALVNTMKAVGTDPKKVKEKLETSTLVGTSAIFRYSKENHTGSDMSSVFVGEAKGNEFRLVP